MRAGADGVDSQQIVAEDADGAPTYGPWANVAATAVDVPSRRSTAAQRLAHRASLCLPVSDVRSPSMVVNVGPNAPRVKNVAAVLRLPGGEPNRCPSGERRGAPVTRGVDSPRISGERRYFRRRPLNRIGHRRRTAGMRFRHPLPPAAHAIAGPDLHVVASGASYRRRLQSPTSSLRAAGSALRHRVCLEHPALIRYVSGASRR